MGNGNDNLHDITSLCWSNARISNRFTNGLFLMEYILLVILFIASILYVSNHIFKTVKVPQDQKCSKCNIAKK